MTKVFYEEGYRLVTDLKTVGKAVKQTEISQEQKTDLKLDGSE